MSPYQHDWQHLAQCQLGQAAASQPQFKKMDGWIFEAFEDVCGFVSQGEKLKKDN